MKIIIDTPYLAPLMTPLKWIGQSMAFVTGPYIRAAKETVRDKSAENPLLKYAGKLADEAPLLVLLPVLAGGVGGLIGGISLAAHLLAGAGIIAQVVGGLATVSAVAAASVVLAPLALGVALAAATLVAVTSVATVPGVLVGCKQTVDHVFKRSPAAPVATPAPAAEPAPSTFDQITAHVATLSEPERQALLDRLQNKAANDFGGAAGKAAAAELDKDITVTKTIKLKGSQP